MALRGITLPTVRPVVELTAEQVEHARTRRPHVVCLDVGRTRDAAVIGVLAIADDIGPDPYRPRLVVKRLQAADQGTSHKALALNVASAVGYYQSLGHPTIAALDATGIGDGTAELVSDLVPVCFRVVITGGNEVTVDRWTEWQFNVPKRELVDVIVRLVSDERLDASRLPPDTQAVLAKEMAGFTRLVTPRPDGSATVRYGNDPTLAEHDDHVLSLAVGGWAMGYAYEGGLFNAANVA